MSFRYAILPLFKLHLRHYRPINRILSGYKHIDEKYIKLNYYLLAIQHVAGKAESELEQYRKKL